MIEDYLKKVLKPRNKSAHKHQCGRVGIIAGSKKYMGAALLTAKSAFRMGAGLVYLWTEKSKQEWILKVLPDCIVSTYDQAPGSLNQQIKSACLDALMIGPGLGTNEMIQPEKWLKQLPDNLKILIDADGINKITPKALKNLKKNQCILTPHEGEFKRMFSQDKIKSDDRENIAKKASQQINQIVVLKGKKTVVTDGDEVYINQTGNEGMAVAGTGDVLSGIIGTLMAIHENTFEAASVGVYLHGLIGDRNYQKYQNGLMASDIIDMIPQIINEIR
mgnify:CR=1 FL=1